MPQRPRRRKPPRARITKALERLRFPKARRFASFIQKGDEGGPIPCWGAIAERFEEEFKTEKERLDVLPALMEEGEYRVLLLFIDANRERPAVLDALVEHVENLPRPAQGALAALGVLERHRERLSPSLLDLLEAGVQEREREQFEERVARLMSFRFFVPDAFDPVDEPNPIGEP